jgi:hypothetical protein
MKLMSFVWQTNMPFTFNSNVNFFYYDEMSAKPENTTFVGWGSTTEVNELTWIFSSFYQLNIENVTLTLQNDGLYSNELYKAHVTVFQDSTLCKMSYENYNNAYMICTGVTGKTFLPLII